MQHKVLVVDDDLSMCEMLQSALAKHGDTAEFRNSAPEAVELLHTKTFDVVLADVRMPGMGGLSLCEHISLEHPDLPVVMITAFGSMETAIDAIRVGAYDFVTKPIDLQHLFGTLDRCISRSRRLAREASPSPTDAGTVSDVERRHIMAVLEEVGGNKSLAARKLGLDRKTLYRKLERFSLLPD